MEKLFEDFSLGLFVWQTVVFVLLIFVLRKFAWKPILNAVNEREENIKNSLEAAKQAKHDLSMLKTQNEDLRKEALAERDALLKEARELKDKILAEAKSNAKLEGDRLIEAARETIKNEKLAAVTEIKNQVAALSIEIAEKIVKHELSSDEKQKSLINNLVEEVNLN